jgi:predicted ATPase
MKTTIFLSKNSDNFSFFLTEEEKEYAHKFIENSLHPCEVVKAFENQINIHTMNGEDLILITHSEAIINWIGLQIYEGKLNHNDFEIVILNDDGNRQISTYDDKGYLNNWWYGFFSYN